MEAIIGLLMMIVPLAVLLVMVAGMWKTCAKAGKPGWAAIVPIYNIVVILQIVGRPVWFLVLLLVPIVNFVVAVLLCLDLAKSFGKSAAYGIGILFLGFIFVPMLGFGSARYEGPAAATVPGTPATA